jgi:hypothetical protein
VSVGSEASPERSQGQKTKHHSFHAIGNLKRRDGKIQGYHLGCTKEASRELTGLLETGLLEPGCSLRQGLSGFGEQKKIPPRCVGLSQEWGMVSRTRCSALAEVNGRTELVVRLEISEELEKRPSAAKPRSICSTVRHG